MLAMNSVDFQDARLSHSDSQRPRCSLARKDQEQQLLLLLLIRPQQLSEDQVVVERHDSYEITATVNQSVLLDRWLNSFGSQIREIKKTAVN